MRRNPSFQLKETPMKRIAIAALAAALLAGATPAFAKEDCDGGYKDFLIKMSSHLSKMSGNDVVEYVRKGLAARDSCTAGDNFSPHGVWDKLLGDMEATYGK
jgi:hypothetical protein